MHGHVNLGDLTGPEFATLEIVKGDLARTPLNFNSLSSQLIKRLPIAFDGGVHGRHLLNITNEGFHSISDSRFCQTGGV